MAALIDEFLPVYTVHEYHSIDVHAPAPVVYAALQTTDFFTARTVRLLFWLRTIPARVLRQRVPHHRKVTMDTFVRSGTLLGDRPAEELAIGLAGQFWKPYSRNERLDRDGFRRFDRPGYVKAVINFSLTQKSETLVNLATETRVLCLDHRSWWWFRVYWLAIAPFSAYTRRQMLRAIKKESEISFHLPVESRRAAHD
jgi:hypothetical protein